jgi:putative adhesin
MNNQRISRSFASIPARSSFLAIGLAVLLASTLAAASTPQGHFEKNLQVSGPVNLEVETGSGDVVVRSGASGSVSIRARIYVGDHWLFGNRQTDVSDIEQHPPVRQEGNSIHIDKVTARNISIDYEITVPVDTAIRAHSGSGNEIIEGTHGNADVQTGSGDVKLSRLTGEIHVQTGSGDVRALEIAGPVRGNTGSGEVEVQEIASGDIDMHTGSGNISIRGAQGALRAETGSGDISAEGTQAGTWQIRTGSGNVHVRLPANAGFDADISTSSGSLDVGAPVTMTVQGRVGETRKHIVGKARGGGPSLAVHTGSGDIHIE